MEQARCFENQLPVCLSDLDWFEDFDCPSLEDTFQRRLMDPSMLLLQHFMLRMQHKESECSQFAFEVDVDGAYCVNRETSRLRVIWQPSDGRIMRNPRQFQMVVT